MVWPWKPLANAESFHLFSAAWDFIRSSFGLKRTPHLLLTQVTQIGRCGVLNLEPSLCFWVFSEVLSHIKNPMAFLAAMPASSRPSSVSKIPLWRNGVAEPVSNKFERQSDIFNEECCQTIFEQFWKCHLVMMLFRSQKWLLIHGLHLVQKSDTKLIFKE